MIDVEKRDGQSEPFDPEKLLRSVRLACKKRPIGTAALTDFVDRLESRFSSRPKRSVSSTEIGDAVMVFLRDLDPVAYVRYASVYRSFDSVDAFLGELRTFAKRSAEPASRIAERPEPDKGS